MGGAIGSIIFGGLLIGGAVYAFQTGNMFAQMLGVGLGYAGGVQLLSGIAEMFDVTFSGIFSIFRRRPGGRKRVRPKKREKW